MKKRKLGLLGVMAASLISLAAPAVAMARDWDDDHGRGYYRDGYGYGYISPHERREREKHWRHEEHERWKHERRYPAPGYRYYNYRYRNPPPSGYYDRWGNWHPYYR